ncbi:MAG: hypothetical protein IFK92_00870 [Acidobacteria bacterium]|nr:hypothetical protein [Candidatus Sulfomarinibacter kjeldsenii]
MGGRTGWRLEPRHTPQRKWHVNGHIVPRKLILDVSRSRIRGKGEIDLLNNTIDLKLSPRPKRRGFISLATPVNINGPLDGPQIDVDTGGFALTVIRVSMYVWTVWLELFKKQLPIDGSDICIDPTPRATESSTSNRP